MLDTAELEGANRAIVQATGYRKCGAGRASGILIRHREGGLARTNIIREQGRRLRRALGGSCDRIENYRVGYADCGRSHRQTRVDLYLVPIGSLIGAAAQVAGAIGTTRTLGPHWYAKPPPRMSLEEDDAGAVEGFLKWG